MSSNPCYGCPKSGCGSYHDQCPEYLSFKKDREKLYFAKRTYNAVTSIKKDGKILGMKRKHRR